MKGFFILYLRIKMQYLPELFLIFLMYYHALRSLIYVLQRNLIFTIITFFHKVMTAQGNNAIGPSRIR
jgi:hypothetical protein